MRKMSLFVYFVLFVLFTTSTLYAGAWTLKKGRLYAKTAFFYQKTNQRFYSTNTPCPATYDCLESGERVPFPFNGESRFTAVYWDFRYGLTNRLELDLQIPFFDIAFTDDANPERPKTTDIGDIRFGARYRFLAKPFVATLKVAAKAPTGFFNKEAEVVPIGDGQWDVEFVGQFGKSLWPINGYVNLDIGYRRRFAPDLNTSSKNPGNEFIIRGEGGYNLLHNLMLKFVVNGLFGTNFKEETFTIQDSNRRILYFEPGIYWTIKAPLALEASIQFSHSGKNYPAGEIYSLGLSYSFSI